MPTGKWLEVSQAGKTLEVLPRGDLGSRICASPVPADGRLYLATTGGWLWAVSQGKERARASRRPGTNGMKRLGLERGANRQ